MQSTRKLWSRFRRMTLGVSTRTAFAAAIAVVFLAVTHRAGAAEPAPAGPTATPVAGMQQAKIRLIAGVGFDPNLTMTKRGCWARVSVLLENQWKSVKGTLRIQKRDAAFRNLIYEQPLDLPKNSRKLWTGYILTDDDQNLLVEYYSGRRRLASEPVAVLPRSPAEVFVMVLTAEESRREFSYLTVKGGDVADSFGGRILRRQQGRYLAYADPRLLPREVIGYHNISAFLWDGGTFGELEKDQEVALKSWLLMGGTLIVGAGENAAAVRQSFLHDILPVEVIGPRSVVLDADFQQAFGSAPAPGEPRVIGLASLRQGKVLMGSAQRPLIVEGRYGAGRIVYVAFSLGSWDLKNWEDNGELLDELLDPARPHLLNQLSGEARWNIDSKLKGSLLAKLPSALFIVAFLGIYIVLVVPVNYFVFRALKRVEYAWLALPVVAIAFALLAYNIGYVKQSKTLDADEITLVEGRAGSEVVLAKTFMAIYSPTRINQPIRFPERCVLTRPLVAQGYVQMGSVGAVDAGSGSRNPLRVQFEKQKGFEVSGFLIHPWAARSFESDYVADLGGLVETNLTGGSAGLNGFVMNRLGYTLSDVALIAPKNRVYQIGSLANGARVSLTGMKYHSTGVAGYFEGVLRRDEETLQRMQRGARRGVPTAFTGAPGGFPGGGRSQGLRLFQESAVAYGQSWFVGTQSNLLPPNTCLLVGWAERLLLDVEVGRKRSPRTLNRRGRKLIHFIKIPIDEDTAETGTVGEAHWWIEPVVTEDRAFAMPPEFDPLADFNQATSRDSEVFLLKYGENVLTAGSSRMPRGANLDSLKIRFKIEKKIWQQRRITTLQKTAYKVALYDYAGQTWVPFGSTTEIQIPKDATRYFDSARREIRLKVDITDNEFRLNWRRGSYGFSQSNAFLSDVKVTETLK